MQIDMVLSARFNRLFVTLLTCVVGIAFGGIAFAQDVDSYEVHPEGQFAGMTGQDVLDASDRAAADGETSAAAGDWNSAYASYHYAHRFRRMVYQGSHPDEFDMEHALAEAAMQSTFFVNAKRHFESAYRNRARLVGPDHPDTFSSLSGYIKVLIGLGLYDRARAILIPAMDRLDITFGSDQAIALDFLQHYGRTLLHQGRLAEARDVFAELLERRWGNGAGQSFATATGLSDLAAAETALGDHSNAMTNAIRAMEILSDLQSVNSIDLAYARATLGDVLFASGDLEGSVAEYQAALQELADVGEDMLLPRTINARLGRAFLRLPQSAHLARPFLEAAIVEDTNNSGTNSDDLDRSVHRMLIDAYAIDASSHAATSQSDGPDEPPGYSSVFDSMVRSFDRSVDQAIVAAIGRSTPGQRGQLVREREQLLTQREELQAEFAAAQGAGGATANEFRIALIHNADAIREADREVSEAFPEYFDFIGSRAIDLETPGELLRPNEALLMIVPTELSTQVLLYSQGSRFWSRTSATPDQIAKAVRRLLWDVGAPNDASANEDDDWLFETEGQGPYPYSFSDAKFLYDQLFANIDLQGIDHVFVVADGPIASLPLGMLVTEIPEGRGGDPETLRGARWLANDTSFSVLPSLQTLYFLRAHRSGAESAFGSSFIGVGDPVLEGRVATRGSALESRRNSAAGLSYGDLFAGGTRSADGPGVDVTLLRSLTRLPGTATELTNIWTTLGRPDDSLLLGDRATETNVKARRFDAEVVVFATHGLLAGEVRGVAEPGLVLTPPNSPSALDDGFLGTSDIVTLNIDAQWVILSACNTAAGDGSPGSSGLSGLARAFFFAGAKNLLVSHWPVRDDVAARLTVRTVELTQGDQPLSRAEALRQAMLEIRTDPSFDSDNDTWAHPNAWAPFSFVGDGSSP